MEEEIEKITIALNNGRKTQPGDTKDHTDWEEGIDNILEEFESFCLWFLKILNLVNLYLRKSKEIIIRNYKSFNLNNKQNKK